MLVFTTRNGDTVTNTFDVLNRLKTRTPQGMPTITYGYDLASRRTDVSTPTVGGDPGSGAFQYFFDSAGRYFKEEYPDGKQVTMQLDANGNVTKLTYPDSYYVERVYDELNRLTDIKLNGSATPEATISYDILSRRANVDFANGTSSEYEFSLTNDMTGLAHSFVGSSANFVYGFNDAHQLTSQNVSDDPFVWHPASAGTVTYAAANDLNQYPTVGGVSYTYNNNGCLTGDGVWTFGYDVLNRFISAVKSGVSASYLYDPMDRQSQKNVGGTKTRFIYNGLQRIAEYDGTAGTLNTRFVYATGLDEPIIEVSSGGTKTFFHRDRLGSIIARTNNSGAVTQRYEYGPYGESAALSGTSFGYTGQRYDAESGLYNYKARYYSPVIGRFLQPDVIGYADGLNLYTYVKNQPLSSVDSLGMAADGYMRDGLVDASDTGGDLLGDLLTALPLAADTSVAEGIMDYLRGRGIFESEAAFIDRMNRQQSRDDLMSKPLYPYTKLDTGYYLPNNPAFNGELPGWRIPMESGVDPRTVGMWYAMDTSGNPFPVTESRNYIPGTVRQGLSYPGYGGFGANPGLGGNGYIGGSFKP